MEQIPRPELVLAQIYKQDAIKNLLENFERKNTYSYRARKGESRYPVTCLVM